MTPPIYAAEVNVLVSPDAEVFIEMRDADADGAVIAVAGLKICAAVDFSEQVTSACQRALSGPAASAAVN